MAASDTLQVGLAFAQRAFENHRNASRTENEALYHTAVTNYGRAIEMLSLTSKSELDTDTKQFLDHKIDTCQNQKAALEDYLKSSMPAVSLSASLSGAPSGVMTQRRSDEREPEQETLDHLFTRLNISREEQSRLPCLDDVVGLENAKDVLREATLLPKQFPEVFKTHRAWKTILLYGPSGVGKTYVTKAIARETNGGLFSLSAGELLARCDTDCEGFIRDLFGSAKRCGSAILCLEDVDMVFSDDGCRDSERVRRMKAELLGELEKLQDSSDEVVFVGTSRSPWLLEEGFLSRMDRRVHTGMPNGENRGIMLRRLLRDVNHSLTEEDIEMIATECETYSGADLKGLVMDAKLEPLRVVQDSTHFRNVLVERNGKKVRMMSPCSGDEDCAIETVYTKVGKNMVYMPAVSYLDFEVASDRTRPTVGLESIERHIDFSRGKR